VSNISFYVGINIYGIFLLIYKIYQCLGRVYISHHARLGRSGIPDRDSKSVLISLKDGKEELSAAGTSRQQRCTPAPEKSGIPVL
jgi:hypothetical protein